MSSALGALLSSNPLVITGMGAVSPAGKNPADLWAAALSGTCSGEMRDGFPVCQITNFHPPPKTRKWSRAAQLAVAAARQAHAQARLDTIPKNRVGIFCGTSRGPVDSWSNAFSKPSAPRLAAATSIASLPGCIAREFDITGPSVAVSATCASAAAAIIAGARAILTGELDAALVGGAESCLEHAVLGPMRAAGLLGSAGSAAQACRPFDTSRNGLIPGEGAGFLVLERGSRARERNAPSLAMLSGWHEGTFPSGVAGMAADGNGLAQCMRQALAMSDLRATEISWVSAHGTGTRLNDHAEAGAMREIFGTDQPFLSSTKPVTGHCLGATPALEAILCVQALQNSTVPPSANCNQPDPTFGVRLVLKNPLPLACFHVVSNSMGFWGCHSSLVFSRSS